MVWFFHHIGQSKNHRGFLMWGSFSLRQKDKTKSSQNQQVHPAVHQAPIGKERLP